MRAWRGATGFAALLIVPLLAGCASTPDDAVLPPGVAPGIPATALEAGRFYTFHHDGGALVFTLDGDGNAAFDLYDGSDRRLGSVGFTSETTRTGLHRIEGVGPGEVVLRLQTINGTLRIQSGGQTVQDFRPLGLLVERAVLVDREPRTDPTGGFLSIGIGPLDPLAETKDVELRRAPAELRLLATGPWSNLSIQVRGERGLVLAASDPGGLGSSGFTLGPQRLLLQLPAAFTPQNLRDGRLTATINADDLGGAILLESTTYSRAPLPAPAEAGPAVDDVAFAYGSLPDGPIAFTVHPEAQALLLWQTDPGNASTAPVSVALFDGADNRLGVVDVPASGTALVHIGAGGGDYVAVALSGKATLGADQAPADFGLRPVETGTVMAPAAHAGSNGRYAQDSEDVDLARAFALRPATLAANGDFTQGMPTGACDADRLLRADQAGEAILAVHDPVNIGQDPATSSDPEPFLQASRALRDGALTILHDGFGDDGCDRLVVAVVSYTR